MEQIRFFKDEGHFKKQASEEGERKSETPMQVLPAGYPTLMMAFGSDAASREFGELDGGDCAVTVRLNEKLADAMRQTQDTVFGTKRYAADEAFKRAQNLWQMALDQAVNDAYKAADRDGKKLIAAWRQGLDQAYTARAELLQSLYPDDAETVQECLMNLYRDAAIDAAIAK